jgi:hypothetical protein
MADSDFITVCKLEMEWLLTWFPVTSSSPLSDVKMRGGTIIHNNAEASLLGGSTEIHTVGQGGSEGDPIAPADRVFALITVGVVGDDALTFMITIELANATVRRTKQFALDPNTTTPFMINVPFREKDEISGDTVAAIQGVFTTSTPLGGIP